MPSACGAQPNTPRPHGAADRGPWMDPSAATTTQGTVRDDRARAPGRTEGCGLPWRHLMWPRPPSQHARLVSPADDEPEQGSRKSSRTETHPPASSRRRAPRPKQSAQVSRTNSDCGRQDQAHTDADQTPTGSASGGLESTRRQIEPGPEGTDQFGGRATFFDHRHSGIQQSAGPAIR